jgi:hypothetical protein
MRVMLPMEKMTMMEMLPTEKMTCMNQMNQVSKINCRSRDDVYIESVCLNG